MKNQHSSFYFALVGGIAILVAAAYAAEHNCQRDLALQRTYPEPGGLAELFLGAQPVKCWFAN
jgi:hypothetical protein